MTHPVTCLRRGRKEQLMIHSPMKYRQGKETSKSRLYFIQPARRASPTSRHAPRVRSGHSLRSCAIPRPSLQVHHPEQVATAITALIRVDMPVSMVQTVSSTFREHSTPVIRAPETAWRTDKRRGIQETPASPKEPYHAPAQAACPAADDMMIQACPARALVATLPPLPFQTSTHSPCPPRGHRVHHTRPS